MTTSLVLTARHCPDDLHTYRCDQHKLPATFVLVWDDEDAEGWRELACDLCLPTLVRCAAQVETFIPVTVIPINVDTYREWAA